MALPDDLQLHGRLPARDQHHPGNPGGVGRHRGAAGLNPPRRLLIRADGAARGNPGPAAAGAVLIDASRADHRSPAAPPLAVVARPLGRQTNNFAEYTAVILALELAHELDAREVELVLDSKLVVEQLMGRWRVRERTLVPLHARAAGLLRQFERWSLRHEPRAANHAADALANLALDDPPAAAAAEGFRAETTEQMS
ncbi:MAG TPA: ribonuclease HI family protein [Candidatus Limnocylindria bacterium]|nr:ribonuclease HI family protein [Candidatus Limnocylindria bacterium]